MAHELREENTVENRALCGVCGEEIKGEELERAQAELAEGESLTLRHDQCNDLDD